MKSGNYGGIFAEYYAARAYANDSYYRYKYYDGPKGDNYYVTGWTDHLVQEQTVASTKDIATAYIPQDEFDATSLMDPGLIYGVAVGAVGIAKDGIGSGIAPHPGRLGGEAHRAAVSDLLDYLRNEYGSNRVATEYGFDTTGGVKGSRYADIAVLDADLVAVEIYQVGLMTEAGIPVARERYAIDDIITYAGYGGSINFLSYR